MPPAARVTDMHVCPMVTGLVPHVGGPILPPGVPTVLIDFLPAATVTDMATCVGPPDVIAMGSTGVFINFLPAARMGDMTAHGGVIVMGSPTCIIGEVGAPSPGAGGLGGITGGLAAAGLTGGFGAMASALGEGGELDGQTGGVVDFVVRASQSLMRKVAGPDAITVGEPGAKLEKALEEVNPEGGEHNCGYITNAVIDRMKGVDPDATAPDRGGVSMTYMETRNMTNIEPSTIEDAFDAVRRGGNGTVGIMTIGWPGGGGHVVAISNDNGLVGIVEAQDWKPQDEFSVDQPPELITDTVRANERYNPDGASKIGFGLVP